jgi:zinc D-Ala-D-Ala carboxypeptidase
MKYFTLKELTKSDTAIRLHINNNPTKQQEYNLIKLVDAILDPLREIYGKPITITSGFRSKTLNTKIGGSSTSQHCCNGRSAAADIVVIKNGVVDYIETKKLYNIIVEHKLPFDQIILEKGTKEKPQWIHVSYDESKSRKQKLYYNGKTYVNI